MKKNTLQLLICLLSFMLFFESNTVSQKIEFEEEEWREEYLNKDTSPTITRLAYSSSNNLEMMDLIYYETASRFILSSWKIALEADKLEKIRVSKKAQASKLIEEKNFIPGKELESYLFENLSPNHLISITPISEEEFIVKKYEFKFE